MTIRRQSRRTVNFAAEIGTIAAEEVRISIRSANKRGKTKYLQKKSRKVATQRDVAASDA
jgi:hypothetical protein